MLISRIMQPAVPDRLSLQASPLYGPPASAFNTRAVTVKEAVRVAPPYDPDSVIGVEVFTLLVEIVKDPLVAPAAIVTLAGPAATPVLLLDRVTTAPADGAAPLS